MSNARPGLVTTDRGGIVENTHLVHAAIVDSTGPLLLTLGNPHRIVLLRSAAKPAQALAIIESGAFTKYGFDDADLALMCGSHNAEEVHVERARSILEKCGASEADLRLGGHPSICPAVYREWVKRGFEPTPVYNNCSGKHAGMLAAAEALGAGLEGYNLLEHPVQRCVRKVTEEVCGLKQEEVLWGVDGCNAPASAIPLDGLARMFAGFAQARDMVDGNGVVSEREEGMARVYTAMSGWPYLVGGQERFDTLLMEAFKGGLIGKIGADGCYGIGVRASEDTKRLGAHGALGVAVKVEDGSLDVIYASVAAVLRLLDIGTEAERSSVEAFDMSTRKNTANVVVGGTRFDFRWQEH